MFHLSGVDCFIKTIAAATENGEMRSVDGESAFIEQPADEAVDQVVRRIDHATTIVADNVDMFVVGQPKRRGPVAEVGVPQQAQLLEQLNGPVDGRGVHIGDGRADAFRGGVLKRTDRLQHLLALRSHSQTPLVQPLGQLGGVRYPRGGQASIVRPVGAPGDYPLPDGRPGPYGVITRVRRWSQVEYVLDT